ncbi:MAG: hypothetical protein ACKOBV_09890 [Candidatus Kapaibacterium sp.]
MHGSFHLSSPALMDISPLFAIDAQKMLGSGDSSGAVQLLERGIGVYPEYTTAYAVIARAYMQMRDTETAYEWVRRGLKRFPSHRALIILESDLRRQTLAGNVPQPAVATPAPSVIPPAPAPEPAPAPAPEPAPEHTSTHAPEPAPESEPGSGTAPPPEAVSPVRAEPVTQAVVEAAAEPVSLAVPHLPEAGEEERLLDDALSNVDDDNDGWEHAREAVEEREAAVPAEDSDAEAVSDAEVESAVTGAPETKEEERLLDDALSNVDDDNDGWMQARTLVEEADPGLRPVVDEDGGTHEPGALSAIDHDDREETRARPEPVRTEEVLQKINVVGGTVVMDGVFMRDVMERLELQGLRLVSTPASSSRRAIRSSAMRLIPGLEFTPLRVQSSPKAYRSVSQLPDMPPFPVIRGSSMNVSPMLTVAPAQKSSRKPSKQERTARTNDVPRTHLEELAQRLEKVRTPVTEEPDGITTRGAAEGVEPTMVTETMAKIYEQQGFTEQAIKAYRQLARVKPEKRDEFERRIAALEASEAGG